MVLFFIKVNKKESQTIELKKILVIISKNGTSYVVVRHNNSHNNSAQFISCTTVLLNAHNVKRFHTKSEFYFF